MFRNNMKNITKPFAGSDEHLLKDGYLPRNKKKKLLLI